MATYKEGELGGYLQLKTDTAIAHSEPVAPGIIFDFDEQDAVVGIEILFRDRVQLHQQASEDNIKKA